MALGTLAGYFGVTLNKLGLNTPEQLRVCALAFGFTALGAGGLAQYGKIKTHFFDIYLNFALNAIFIASLTADTLSIYSLVWAGLMAACFFYAVTTRKFLYIVYAFFYGYIGVSKLAYELFCKPLGVSVGYMQIILSVLTMVAIYRVKQSFEENQNALQ